MSVAFPRRVFVLRRVVLHCFDTDEARAAGELLRWCVAAALGVVCVFF